MVTDRLLIIYGVVNFLFLASGCVMIAMAVTWSGQMAKVPTMKIAAANLLLADVPTKALIANGVFVITTSLIMVPATFIRTTISWLRLQAWLVVVCSIFTLCVGLAMWFKTLMTRNGFMEMWKTHTDDFKALLQENFKCCGYMDGSEFIQSPTCANALVATTMDGCVGPLSQFGSNFLNVIFTAAFGIVALDVLLLLCVAMLQKVRGEGLRYRDIDRKRGVNNI